MDHGNIKKPAHGGTGKKNLGFLFLPAAVVIMALVLLLTPRPEGERREITLRTLELPAFPITLVLEENEGETAAAWLRTPAGARRIEQVEGLSFISSDPVVSRADQDDSDDLLWRISFMNVKGEGIHLWIGMTTWAPRVYVAATPFQYTRWHALPAKIEVPKGTSLYISPAAPLYRTLEKQFGGTDSYSFVYTMMLTPEGLNFVPVPSVYKQLAVLLRAGMHGESSPPKRLAYVRMLTEFNRLADGNRKRVRTDRASVIKLNDCLQDRTVHLLKPVLINSQPSKSFTDNGFCYHAISKY